MTAMNSHLSCAVLPGVQKVGYHVEGRYYFTPFAACFRSCMAFLGENYSYEYVMGMSGAAFRLMWNATMWDGGNVDIVFMAEDKTEPLRRAFQATGYACEFLEKQDTDEIGFRERIIESIHDKGRPLMAFGVIGPPEVCIVTGYDEGDGNDFALIGWNFFQDRPGDFAEQAFEPAGYFYKHDWFANTHGLILIGDKQEKPPLKALYHGALEWALQVVRTPMVHEYYGGLRAYEAWAEWMQRDQDFADDIALLSERKMVQYDAMCMVSERGKAAAFLRQIAAYEPAIAEELKAAAKCYDEETAVLGKMHEATGGYIPPGDHEKLRKLADPAARKQIAEAALRARDKDAEAADYIERALVKWE